MIDYKLLLALATVVEQGGFEKAAQVLCLTQSAVSQRVRLLEDRLGKILLSRTAPPRPTAAGAQLVKHFHQVKLLEGDLESTLGDPASDAPTRLAIGINADSLASWFLPAIGEMCAQEEVLLDLWVDDQEQTHHFLKAGTVVGCISDHAASIQGCRVQSLGEMRYRLLATPAFKTRWFADGLTGESVQQAPAVIFNRKDMLHHRFVQRVVGTKDPFSVIHYVPSPEQFLEMIRRGYGYGMVPDWQSRDLLQSDVLVDLCAERFEAVALYWHCWNLSSPLLQKFSAMLTVNAARLLA